VWQWFLVLSSFGGIGKIIQPAHRQTLLKANITHLYQTWFVTPGTLLYWYS